MAFALKCFAIVGVCSSVTSSVHGRSMWSGDDLAMVKALKVFQPQVGGPYPDPSFVDQPQDHFDTSNTNMWKQAYYVNDKFWTRGSDAPIFVCVGGEGPPLDGSAVVNSVHCNNAVEWLNETKALMFAVEHRYYGCHNMSACPVPVMSNNKKALQFLSSKQALADLANFVTFATKTYGLTTANKWVSWGGSYPGMLAGWFRLKYPNLVHASVASSAPVLAQLDFQGYDDVTASAYSVSDNNVGGSQPCEDAIRIGHANIKTMFGTAAGRSTLSKLFHRPASSFLMKAVQAAFAGNGVAYFPSQGNDPSCTQAACNIKLICAIMTNSKSGDEVTRLAEVQSSQSAWMGMVKGKSHHAMAAPQDEADYWGWQTCTEFGFYQTCEIGTQCFYAQGYDLLADQISTCTGFGISVAEVTASINATNKYYGGRSPAGSCILYPNGEVDPWHYLGVLEKPSAGIDTLMVPGASHHAWTHPSAPSDQPSVVAARLSIRSTVTGYLKSDCSPPSQ